MLRDPERETELISAFVAALTDVPQSAARLADESRSARGLSRPDFVVEAEIGGTPVTFLVEVKQHAFPRDVRETIWNLKEHSASLARYRGSEVVPLLIAEAISPGARSRLREAGVGYFDRSGSVFAPARGAFVFIDRPQPKAARRALGSVFRGRRAQVLFSVFELRDYWLTVKEVSEASRVSPYTASQTLSALERRDWMTARGSGPSKQRRLVDAKAMVDAWASHVASEKSPPLQRYFVPGPSESLPTRLADACEAERAEYALTGAAAAQIYSPYLTNVPQTVCRMHIEPAADAALRRLGARPVKEGWNLGIVRVPRDIGLGSATGPRVPPHLAPPLQIYLDLLQGSGRSRDMAEHFRRETLKV